MFERLKLLHHKDNHKRVYRIYTDMKLKLRRKHTKRLPERVLEPLVQPIRPNLYWSMDFMHDGLIGGRPFRSFNVIDEFNNVNMNEDWRFSAKSITKYNPIYRDYEGHYTKDEWIGFFQIGKQFEDGILTFDKYIEVEKRYIEAAQLFFKFHNCNMILIHGLEKYGFDEYIYPDKLEMEIFFGAISEGSVIEIKSLGMLVKLILREMLWAECICKNNNEIVLRFSYDFYMYFNSNRNMNDLYRQIEKIGLYVW